MADPIVKKTGVALDEAARQRRREAGEILMALRQGRGLRQRDLATRIGLEPHKYPFIAQIEAGANRILTERYAVYAEALGVEIRTFTVAMMFYYDRALYDLLFDGPPPQLRPTRTEPLLDEPEDVLVSFHGAAR